MGQQTQRERAPPELKRKHSAPHGIESLLTPAVANPDLITNGGHNNRDGVIGDEERRRGRNGKRRGPNAGVAWVGTSQRKEEQAHTESTRRFVRTTELAKAWQGRGVRRQRWLAFPKEKAFVNSGADGGLNGRNANPEMA